MTLYDFVLPILYGLGAFISAYLALKLICRQSSSPEADALSGQPVVFLLRDGELVDANFSGQRLLDRSELEGTNTEKLLRFMSQRFSEPELLVSASNLLGDTMVSSIDGQTQAFREVSGKTVRLKLRSITGTHPDASDMHIIEAMQQELETLRANTKAAPFLLWRQNEIGQVTWVNAAYLDTVETLLGPEAHTAWPLPVLFPELQKIEDQALDESKRLSIETRNPPQVAWYDCHITSVGHDHLCTAFPADEAVRAETRRREFTQTLTKTFAELAIGLAIFDRSRRLVLFNPALTDLTNLPSEFLTSRPGMVSFLDRLRDNRVMPEPRDYRSWRKSIAELEAAATDGTYSETWSLPDGQTFHVTGRPHPDGAVALLFEDISAEMSLTRRFRAELEQSQTVLDHIEDAVALFSQTGQMVMSNAAYTALWQVDHEETLSGTDVTEATRAWHQLTTPTPIWGDFRDFTQQSTERAEWSASVTMLDGRVLNCRFQPMKAGATLAVFRPHQHSADTATSLRKVV